MPLPWPVEIELALKKAELLAFVETSDPQLFAQPVADADPSLGECRTIFWR